LICWKINFEYLGNSRRQIICTYISECLTIKIDMVNFISRWCTTNFPYLMACRGICSSGQNLNHPYWGLWCLIWILKYSHVVSLKFYLMNLIVTCQNWLVLLYKVIPHIRSIIWELRKWK
jgi:hypothetical protein